MPDAPVQHLDSPPYVGWHVPVTPSQTPDDAVPPVELQKAASPGLPMSKQEELDGESQHVADGSVVVVVGQLAGGGASLRRNVFWSDPLLTMVPPNVVQYCCVLSVVTTEIGEMPASRSTAT
jgi:hypothetical protein